MAERTTYPIGQQDFKSLRERGSVYVDKTQYIEKIIKSGSLYYFLARPRRFGKSLFLSTLRYFFEGERDLFSGLYIDSSDWSWKKHPVLYLDLNTGDYSNAINLDNLVENHLEKWERRYNVPANIKDNSIRFQNIIQAAHETTGQQVVILVDEYDKPLVKNLNDESFDIFRTKLAGLYSNFKSCAPHIRLLFMSGVSRFSKLSIFSDLNNVNDITFSKDYADICGITQSEMNSNFKSGIEEIASEYDLSYETALVKLKANYDGYRFHEEGSDIYNPWSLLNCFDKKEIANYWNETGMPTLVAESLKRIDADLESVFHSECPKKRLRGLDLKSADPIALLYQTGYLTIKGYDREYETFTLGIPNREVKEGLFDVLLPYYVKVRRGTVSDTVFKLINGVRSGNAEEFMKNLQAYFAGIPYRLKMDDENNFHNAFFILMSLLDLSVEAEASTSDGRMDLLLKSKKFIFIVELKYDGSAQAALDQIEHKKYAMQFHGDSRTIIKIGVNFSSKFRRIENWVIG